MVFKFITTEALYSHFGDKKNPDTKPGLIINFYGKTLLSQFF